MFQLIKDNPDSETRLIAESAVEINRVVIYLKRTRFFVFFGGCLRKPTVVESAKMTALKIILFNINNFSIFCVFFSKPIKLPFLIGEFVH